MANDIELKIPETFNFDELEVFQDPVTKTMHCKLEPLVEVLEFNGIHAHLFRERPYFKTICLAAMTECYRVHLERGGTHNAIMDGVMALGPGSE